MVHSFLSMGMELAREALKKKYDEKTRAPCFFQDRDTTSVKNYLQNEYQWGSYACMKLIKSVMDDR